MTNEPIDIATIREVHGHERDSHGCFLGCYSHGCEGTRCADMKPYWRAAVERGDITPNVECWRDYK